MRRRSFLALPGLALLAGCAGLPRQPLDRTAAAQIRSVAVVTPAAGSPDAWLKQAVGYQFGLIGSLIEEGMRASRQRDLRAILAEENLATTDLLAAQLVDRLQKRGMQAFVLPAARPDTKFLATCPATDQPFDAWLDATVQGFGFVAESPLSPWRPFAHVHVRLVRRQDNATLMQERVAFNQSGAPTMLGGTPPGVVLDDAGQHDFATFDRLTGDRVRAAGAVRVALERAAEGVASLLA